MNCPRVIHNAMQKWKLHELFVLFGITVTDDIIAKLISTSAAIVLQTNTPFFKVHTDQALITSPYLVSNAFTFLSDAKAIHVVFILL